MLPCQYIKMRVEEHERERETSDLFKLHKCREGPLCFSGGCWLVP